MVMPVTDNGGRYLPSSVDDNVGEVVVHGAGAYVHEKFLLLNQL